MILYSASRRTDLVAFYPDYICEKVNRSRKLGGIVFWTKDPRNLISHPQLKTIVSTIPCVVQLTITGLAGSWWEPDVPSPDKFCATLQTLSEILPHGAVRWRFDPIIYTADLPERFLTVKSLLDKCGINPESVVVSFPDAYSHAVKRLALAGGRFTTLTFAQRKEILANLHEAGGIPLELCCESELLGEPYLKQSHCIDGALFDRLYGTDFARLPDDPSQRVQCGCCKSTDIGRYDMLCGHNCRYCYARPVSDAENGIEKK